MKGREYPRFLFSNPKNTKSKGPFVIHLLEPRVVFRVVFQKADDKEYINSWSGLTGLCLLDPIKNEKMENQIQKVIVDATVWFEKQMEERTIDIS